MQIGLSCARTMQYDGKMLKPTKRQITFAFAAIACCAVTFIVGIGFGIRQPQAKLQFDNGPVCKIPIRVIEPKFGHAPVRPETVETVKELLRRLPPTMYNLLVQGGATVNLAPNIEDNWPGSGDGRRPGPIEMTMGEESGRTYGRDVWLYESAKVRGSQKLKPSRDQDEMRENLYQLLGHSINDCMGVVTKKDELVQVYKEDLGHMSGVGRMMYLDSSQDNDDSRALGCSSIIGVLVRQEDDPILRDFPRTTAYLKKALIQK